MIKYGYTCQILDCDALKLTEEEAVGQIIQSKSRLSLFVLYGQQPNQGTFLMIGATSLAEKLKESSDMVGFVGFILVQPKEVLSYDFVDFVFINEGVYALRDLLKLI